MVSLTPRVYELTDDFKPFVYGLVDPLDPQHVRYVGMATQPRRPYEHTREAKKDAQTNSPYKTNWIRSLLIENREPLVLVLEELPETVTTSFLGFIESCYIKSLREIGHRLTNLTDGGEGLINPSEEVREKIGAKSRAAMSNPAVRKQISEKQKIRLAARPDLVEAASMRARAQKVSDEVKLVIGERSKEHWLDPEYREKTTIGIRSTWSDPVVKAAQSDRIKASWKDPARRTRQSESLAKFWTEEERAANGERSRKRYADPEERKKHSEAMKAYFKRRKLETSGE